MGCGQSAGRGSAGSSGSSGESAPGVDVKVRVAGDWSWLNKVRVTGPDATRFLDWAPVKSVASQETGQTLFTPLVSEQWPDSGRGPFR